MSAEIIVVVPKCVHILGLLCYNILLLAMSWTCVFCIMEQA